MDPYAHNTAQETVKSTGANMEQKKRVA